MTRIVISAIVILAATLAAEPRITTWPVPDKQIPTEIARHGDALWFVSWHIQPKLQAWIGKVTTNGKFKMHDVPADHMPGITASAPDGTLWLSDAKQPLLWHISKDGRIEKIATKLTTQGLAFGPDGNLWSTHARSAAITRLGTDGSVKQTWNVFPPIPSPTPVWIVSGSDGALWFTEPGRGNIGRITTSGQITLYPVSPGLVHQGELIAGPDGAMWFATAGDAIGRITTKGEVTTVKTGFRAGPLAADAKGRIWYANGAHTGYIEDGKAHEFEVKGAKSIRSLAGGPDGAMWFADQDALTIGKIELLPPAAPRP